MTLREALAMLDWTKPDLMSLAYNGDYSGIDTAIPQGAFDEMGLKYGAIDEARDAFFFATDCTGIAPFVVDLRIRLPAYLQAAIIAEAELMAQLRSGGISNALYKKAIDHHNAAMALFRNHGYRGYKG